MCLFVRLYKILYSLSRFINPKEMFVKGSEFNGFFNVVHQEGFFFRFENYDTHRQMLAISVQRKKLRFLFLNTG